MTIPRMLVLLVCLAGIGVAVVAIRVEESRVLRRIQELQFEEAEARQEIGRQEMTMATLRAPTHIRERAEQLRPEPEPPAPRRPAEPRTNNRRR